MVRRHIRLKNTAFGAPRSVALRIAVSSSYRDACTPSLVTERLKCRSILVGVELTLSPLTLHVQCEHCSCQLLSDSNRALGSNPKKENGKRKWNGDNTTQHHQHHHATSPTSPLDITNITHVIHITLRHHPTSPTPPPNITYISVPHPTSTIVSVLLQTCEDVNQRLPPRLPAAGLSGPTQEVFLDKIVSVPGTKCVDA